MVQELSDRKRGWWLGFETGSSIATTPSPIKPAAQRLCRGRGFAQVVEPAWPTLAGVRALTASSEPNSCADALVGHWDGLKTPQKGSESTI